MQQIQWQDRFNIGVEIVDQAHQKLFSIVQKIMELYIEKHENQFACVEGIKYFKAYAIKHFAEEEAYMRKIGYSDYSSHKKIHDRMKLETLPALERLLYDSNFSTEAVQRFIGVCTGWLTGHIIIEDRAIIGKSDDKPVLLQLDNELSVIQALFVRPLQEIFGCSVQFIGKYSTKDVISDAQYYELTYSAQEKPSLRIILVIGREMLLRAAGEMLGIDFYENNEIVRFAIQEIAQNLIQRAAVTFGKDPDEYHLETERSLVQAQFDKIFYKHLPKYSLLFQAKNECFALCIDQLPEHNPTH